MVISVWTVPHLTWGRLRRLLELALMNMNDQLPLSLNIPSKNIIRLTGMAYAFWIGKRTGIGEGCENSHTEI